MNTEDDEFRRIEAEALRRAAQDDDDTQAYTSETVAVKAYRLGYEAGVAAERKACAMRQEQKGATMTDLRQAAQQALECIEHLNMRGWILADFEDEVYAAITALKVALEQSEPLPQRTWVGLTEEDLDYLCHLAYTGDEEFALIVQARLKEKNT